MEVLKSALVVAPEEFEEAWGLWDTLPWTPNPMNKKYNKPHPVERIVSRDRYPTRVLDFTREQWTTTWYPDGTAGLEPHA
jgi:hypothetical protein